MVIQVDIRKPEDAKRLYDSILHYISKYKEPVRIIWGGIKTIENWERL